MGSNGHFMFWKIWYGIVYAVSSSILWSLINERKCDNLKLFDDENNTKKAFEKNFDVIASFSSFQPINECVTVTNNYKT